MKTITLSVSRTLTFASVFFISAGLRAQSNWNIPNLDAYAERSYGYYGEHLVIDMNGDNKPDLVDLEDDANNGSTWMSASQKYWKVYLNTGSAFNLTAANWNIPALDNYAYRTSGSIGEHLLMDMNGDHMPDLIDLENDGSPGNTWTSGSQKYWKIYLNTGSGFNLTASNWNIPTLDAYAARSYGSYGEHSLVDVNGDGKPDLIDLEDDANNGSTWMSASQKYWKVYLNTGSGFNLTAANWNIPNLDNYAERLGGYYGEHQLIDVNGDHMPDLIDLENDGSPGNTWTSGLQKYWKIYLNTGSGFNLTAANWNIPTLDSYAERSSGYYGEHALIDANGDGKPDLIDLEDDANNGYTWMSASQKYWKVYVNTGSGFNLSAGSWNIPTLDNYAERLGGYYGEHMIADMNGDNTPDLIDLENDGSPGNTWTSGSQKYWKVYLNSFVGVTEYSGTQMAVSVYPVPATDVVTVTVPGENSGFSISVYNSLGEVVREEKYSGSSATLDVSDLPAGIYLIGVHGQKGTVTRKLLKQ